MTSFRKMLALACSYRKSGCVDSAVSAVLAAAEQAGVEQEMRLVSSNGALAWMAR
jgi:multimeric flavodoxin WrbA